MANNFYEGDFYPGLKLQVRTLEDLLTNYHEADGKIYGMGDSFMPDMRRYCGTQITIDQERYFSKGCYIKEDNNYYTWLPEMFKSESAFGNRFD